MAEVWNDGKDIILQPYPNEPWSGAETLNISQALTLITELQSAVDSAMNYSQGGRETA